MEYQDPFYGPNETQLFAGSQQGGDAESGFTKEALEGLVTCKKIVFNAKFPIKE